MKNRKKRRLSSEARRQNKLGYLFLLPWLIGFLTFTAVPLVYTVFLSLNNVNLSVRGWEMSFVGLENYIAALLRNVEFTPAIFGFITMEILYVPVIVIISFILANLLNQKIKGRSFFRTIYFLPVIVLSGSVMLQLMDSGTTKMLGVEEIFIFKMISNYSENFGDILITLFDNFSMILWFTGIPIILFINGLQKINRQLYEAAQIDGATSWQILWKITLPIIKPFGLIITIFSIVQLGLFPINPVYNLIQEAIANTSSGLGIASAFAWVYSFVVLLLIGVAFLLFKERKEPNDKKQKKQYERELEKLYAHQERQSKKQARAVKFKRTKGESI